MYNNKYSFENVKSSMYSNVANHVLHQARLLYHYNQAKDFSNLINAGMSDICSLKFNFSFTMLND